MKPTDPEPRFAIELPDGRTARVPQDVLFSYADADGMVHRRSAGDDDDVTSHDMKPDPVTGVSEYHTDYEHGECTYDDGNGPNTILAWHRHPFGTEYAELFEG
jgi:hypothetical protein